MIRLLRVFDLDIFEFLLVSSFVDVIYRFNIANKTNLFQSLPAILQARHSFRIRSLRKRRPIPAIGEYNGPKEFSCLIWKRFLPRQKFAGFEKRFFL